MGLTQTWEFMRQMQNCTNLTQHAEEGPYALWVSLKKNGTRGNCSITKPRLKCKVCGETAEMIYHPSGEECTNISWGMYIPSVGGVPQHGDCSYMQTGVLIGMGQLGQSNTGRYPT